MSRHCLLLAVVVLTACGPQVDQAAEEQAIRSVSARWAALDEQKDAAGVAALFAEDGTIIWEQRAPVTGREAIRAHMETSYKENPSGEGSFGPDRVVVAASGDLAVELGAYQNPADQGRYVTVHGKVGGEWRVLTDMSVSTAADGGAPDWAAQHLASWYEAYNARDANALADLYASNAQVNQARGRSAIIAQYEADWAETGDTCRGAFDGFEMVGSLATGWGRDFCTSAAGEETISRWLSFYERQPDGRWVMIRDLGETIE